MALRTSAELVAGICTIDKKSWPALDPFMVVANELVTEICSEAGYSDLRMELIERWLSAHFYSIADPQAAAEGAGDVNVRVQQRINLGFSQTRWGQQAMRMDTAGGLATLDNKMKRIGEIKPGTERIKITPSLTYLGGWE